MAKAQTSLSNQVKICDKVIEYDSTYTVNQNFQSVKGNDFDLMWLYLVINSSFQGSKIYQNSKDEIVYESNYNLESIMKNGFSIYPKKNDEVIYKPVILTILGIDNPGLLIEINGKKEIKYYLTSCGNICNRVIGFQVNLTYNPNKGGLPDDLRKIITFKEL